MPDTARRYTVQEVVAFPSDGNLVLLARYLEQYRHLAQALVSPADITWGTEDDLAQPDVFVVPVRETSDEWDTIRTLLLAVEVLSPSTARYDRITKRRLYQEHGVVTYWVVDPDARLVEVWHPGDERPEIVTDRLTWRVAADAPELVIELDEVLERV